MRRTPIFVSLALLAVASGCSSDPGGAGGGSSSSTGGSTGEGGGAPCGADFTCDVGLICDGEACRPTVAPFMCPKDAPVAMFVRETPPPATLEPWSRSYATITYANCGAEAWTATPADAGDGVKLAPAAPREFAIWTPGRLPIPADVPAGHRVIIPVPIHAPALTGTFEYRYDLLRENVAYFDQPTPSHKISVKAELQADKEICPGVTADPSGHTSATAALQECIDNAASGSILALEVGVYRISGVLTIDKPLTLMTKGATGASCLDYNAPKCAVLRADISVTPSTEGMTTRGFLRLGTPEKPVKGVTLDHIVVDGDRVTRFASAAAKSCAAGNSGDGVNISAHCKDCSILGIASTRAVCGSGMEWDGDGLTVLNSTFYDNGNHAVENMWADGITIIRSNGATVQGNFFLDNSSVGLVASSGVGSKFVGNTLKQLTQELFAAIMLDNFDPIQQQFTSGDFSGASVEENSILCAGHSACHFGIELGGLPWRKTAPNIVGGSVTKNYVTGCYIDINAQGTGTPAKPTVIAENNLVWSPTMAKFSCGKVEGLTSLNVSPESHVDLKGEMVETGNISVPCP